MKKGLSQFANYCRDRKIRCLFVGRHKNVLFFNVRGVATDRIKANFERQLREDNPSVQVNVCYL